MTGHAILSLSRSQRCRVRLVVPIFTRSHSYGDTARYLWLQRILERQ